MTDVSAPLNPIQQRLAEIREEQARRGAVAEAEAATEAGRISKLNDAKARCVTACGAVADALAETTDPEERAALIALESETHAEHAADLEHAYLEFASQREGNSNPAPAGETQIDAATIVTGSDALGEAVPQT